jgi:hypothetical protein
MGNGKEGPESVPFDRHRAGNAEGLAPDRQSFEKGEKADGWIHGKDPASEPDAPGG